MGSSRRTFILFLLVPTAFGLVGSMSCGGPAADMRRAARSVEELTGGPTRVVWVQSTEDHSDVFARGTALRLMGWDSRDGRGERVLLAGPSNFHKPLLSPCGEYVAYSDALENAVYRWDWGNPEAQRLADGMALAFWKDPRDHRVWLYIGRERNEERGFAFGRIIRIPLDAPVDEEVVWTAATVQIDSFQLSADGRRAAGLFPWPNAGIAHLSEHRWERIGRGCWVSMAPDNSYTMWIFDGSHRNLLMTDTRSGRRWEVNISRDSAGGHEVYHPRWSNHPDVFTFTGPYLIRSGGNNIRGGGPEVEVHIGRFNEDRTEVADWIQLTENDRGNFYPDVWVERGVQDPIADEILEEPDVPEAPTKTIHDARLLLLWDRRDAENHIATRTDTPREPEEIPRQQARYGRFLEMDVRGGFFELHDPDGLIGRTIVDSGELTVSLYVMPDDAMDDPADLMAVRTADGIAVILLAIENGYLTLQVIGALEPDAPVTRTLAPAPDGPAHVTITMDTESVHTFIDGTHISTAHGLMSLPPETIGTLFHFGGGPSANRNWSGFMEGIRIYGRALDATTVQHEAMIHTERARQRPPPRTIRLQARLLHASSTPTPEEIAPYRRGLLQNQYEIVDVLEGDFPGDQILINHWVILDGEVIETLQWQEGDIYEFLIEAVEDRPELEGERVSTDVPDLTLPEFLDIE